VRNDQHCDGLHGVISFSTVTDYRLTQRVSLLAPHVDRALRIGFLFLTLIASKLRKDAHPNGTETKRVGLNRDWRL
jgi:hypothetical protein